MAKIDKQIDDLIKVYLDARERLINTIVFYDGVGTKVYANTILQQLESEINTLQKASDVFAETALPDVYKNELQSIYRYFTRNNLLMKSPANFASIHVDALYQISREMQYQISEGLASVGRQVTRYVDRTQDELLRQIGLKQSGIKTASGGTIQDMQAALIKDFRENGFMTVQYGEGKNAREVPIDIYARMVARSTTREAGNTARINQLTTNGYDLVEMSTHYPTCGICSKYQGRVFSISGNDKRFPALSEAFGAYNNIHPNCRHVIVPWIEELKTPKEIADAIAFSNSPFSDTRKDSEISLYNSQQDRARRLRNDLYQYERYKSVLKDEAPGTIRQFRKIKKDNGDAWETLQKLYRKNIRH